MNTSVCVNISRKYLPEKVKEKERKEIGEEEYSFLFNLLHLAIETHLQSNVRYAKINKLPTLQTN